MCTRIQFKTGGNYCLLELREYLAGTWEHQTADKTHLRYLHIRRGEVALGMFQAKASFSQVWPSVRRRCSERMNGSLVGDDEC